MSERTGQGCCYDCGRKYGDEFGFPDLLVPNDVWAKISPSGGHGGLLCSACIVRRCALAGIRCEARWASGPLNEVHPDDDTADWMRRPALTAGHDEWRPVRVKVRGRPPTPRTTPACENEPRPTPRTPGDET